MVVMITSFSATEATRIPARMEESMVQLQVLAFYGNLDDAEFHCAGSLVRLAAAGRKVHIAGRD